MKALEDAEIDHGEGPCLDAYRYGERVAAEDLRDEVGRWPDIVPLALDMGLLAAYAFPLRLREDRIGALNLYRDSPGAFERLRRHARSNHMTVRATAQAVIENGREALAR